MSGEEHEHSAATCPFDAEGPSIWWLCGYEPMFTPAATSIRPSAPPSCTLAHYTETERQNCPDCIRHREWQRRNLSPLGRAEEP